VLVGDHHQLPLFLDNEVKGWMPSLSRQREAGSDRAQMISDLLHRSAFEQPTPTLTTPIR